MLNCRKSKQTCENTAFKRYKNVFLEGQRIRMLHFWSHVSL